MKRIKLIFIFSITAALFSTALTFASEIKVNASVTPEKGSVGQPFTYTVTVSGIEPGSLKITPPEKKIVFPEKKPVKQSKKDKSGDDLSAEESVPLYIIGNAAREDSGSGGNGLVKINIILTYYRTGTYTLPEIKIDGSDGVTPGYKIPSVTIEETNKEGTFEDIEPPVSLSGNYTRVILLVIILLVIAAAAFFVYRYLKKRRKQPVPPEPVIPPIEIFLKQVESLKLSGLINEGRINEYVFGISIIFRRYLSSMFAFDAAEMTTDEIEKKIKKYMPADLYSVYGTEIIDNMRLWDYSKFAEFTPSAELLLQNLDATVSTAKRISGIERGDDGTVRV